MIRLDSPRNDMSNSGAIGSLIILRLLYPDSCSKWFFLVLAAWCIHVLCVVVFFDHGTASRQPQCVCVKLYFATVSTNRQPTVSKAATSIRSD